MAPQHVEAQELGRTKLPISRIGFGTWGISGSGWRYSLGAQDDRESVAAIHQALDAGINWIDTAPIYGDGHAERLIARALRGREESVYVFTKCSWVWSESDELTADEVSRSLRREVEGSLCRLERDVVDLLQIHSPIPDSLRLRIERERVAEEHREGRPRTAETGSAFSSTADADLEVRWATLNELKAEGKVRHIGLSNCDVRQILRAQAIAPVETLQPVYSLLHREIEHDVLPFCEDARIGVIVYSPMATGLLSGRWTTERVMELPEGDCRREEPDFLEPRLSRALALVDQLRPLARSYNCSPGALAIAWTLQQSAVSGAIVGFRSPTQVTQLVGAPALRLSAEDIARMNNLSNSS